MSMCGLNVNNKIHSIYRSRVKGENGIVLWDLIKENRIDFQVAESGNVREFQRLITTDLSKLNVRDGRGRAAVHQATIRNHVPILQVVVAFNGNLNLTDNHENTPLHLAVEFETLDTLEFLLAK